MRFGRLLERCTSHSDEGGWVGSKSYVGMVLVVFGRWSGRVFLCIVKSVRLVSLGRAAVVLFYVTGMHEFLKIRGCLGCFAGDFWVVSEKNMVL